MFTPEAFSDRLKVSSNGGCARRRSTPAELALACPTYFLAHTRAGPYTRIHIHTSPSVLSKTFTSRMINAFPTLPKFFRSLPFFARGANMHSLLFSLFLPSSLCVYRAQIHDPPVTKISPPPRTHQPYRNKNILSFGNSPRYKTMK